MFLVFLTQTLNKTEANTPNSTILNTAPPMSCVKLSNPIVISYNISYGEKFPLFPWWLFPINYSHYGILSSYPTIHLSKMDV